MMGRFDFHFDPNWTFLFDSLETNRFVLLDML
jgi:hypothetical protein